MGTTLLLLLVLGSHNWYLPPVVGAAVDGVSDVELQVLQVDVPELQCAYLADAQSACQEGEPEREPLVVGEERGQPVDLVGGDRRLVTSFGLRFDDAVPARARGDERRGAVRLFVRGGEHDSFECSRRLFERPCRQLVPGVHVPFVDHLAGDAVERCVAERLVEPA